MILDEFLYLSSLNICATSYETTQLLPQHLDREEVENAIEHAVTMQQLLYASELKILPVESASKRYQK